MPFGPLKEDVDARDKPGDDECEIPSKGPYGAFSESGPR
jgi:hypothetical protein